MHIQQVLVVLLTLGLLASGGLATADDRLESGDDATTSYDGLKRIKKSAADEAYIKPDIDLTAYTSVVIDEPAVSYKRTPRKTSTTRATGSSANFALTDDQMAEMKQMFHEEFIAALVEDDGWTVVDAVGPDVLEVHAELVNLVVKVPTKPTAGRSTYYVSEFGEVTLVGELRDSQSGEILARAVDRQVIRPIGASQSQMRRTMGVSARSDVRRYFRQWAELLRDRLDEVKEVGAPPTRD